MLRGKSLLVVLIALLLILSLGVPSIRAADGILGYHTVMPGETIYCIARAYGVSPWEVALRNHLIRVNLLHVGEVLAIPAAPLQMPPGPQCHPQFFSPYADPTASCRVVHRIAPGETLSAIGRRYGVDIWTIASYNHLFNPNIIRAGDTLCIP